MTFLTQKSWSPYVVGALIGMLSWFTFGVAQKAIGISTNFSQAVKITEEAVVPQHAADNLYFKDFKISSKIGWEAALLVGVLLGAFVSARLSGAEVPQMAPPLWRERFGPSTLKAGAAAFAGGVLLLLGARWAGGCTSGHGISGSLQLAVSSWAFFASFFITGIATAFLLYGKGKNHV